MKHNLKSSSNVLAIKSNIDSQQKLLQTIKFYLPLKITLSLDRY